MSTESIRKTLGVVLVGGFVCGVLTGTVWMQTAFYFRVYPKDAPAIKRLVCIVWFMDSLHTSMVFASNWIYLINHYGNAAIANTIPWTVGLTVVITAIITFIAHCFFVHRILTLSRRNWWVAGPLFLLSFLRVASAMVSTIEMITRANYANFKEHVGFIFTLGLSISSLLDVLITGFLLYYLKQSRNGFLLMDHIIDTLSIYTLENGLATGVFTIIALICWLSMNHNLIFLTLHFVISKLYANSFLATLNARERIRERTMGSDNGNHQLPLRLSPNNHVQNVESKLEINVERTIKYDIEESGIKSLAQIVSDARDSKESLRYAQEKTKGEGASPV